MTSDHSTLPGTTIIRADGTIAFRRVASAKDDRMTAAELLVEIDRTLGTHGPALADPHYAAIDRMQVRLDAGGGATDRRATAVTSLSALLPLSRQFLVGPRVAFDVRDTATTLGGVLALRVPITGNAGALELGYLAGWNSSDDLQVGASATLWFALSPAWALHLAATATSAPSYTLSFGASRLIEW